MAAAWFGFGAAALGCFVAVLSALVLWIPDSAASGTSGSTMRAGVLTFLAAQGGGVRINGVDFGFVPLGLTLVAGWLCWRSGRALMALPRIARDARPGRLAGLSALAAATYAVTCLALVHFATVGSSSAPLVGVGRGAILVGVVGFGGAALVGTPLGQLARTTMPAPVRCAVRAATAATSVLLAGGAVLALSAVALHASRFMDFSRAMGRGFAGVPVALLDVLAAPNAVVASTAYLAGPGFAVGQGVTYSPFGGHGGLVPAFAILAGLPNAQQPTVAVQILMGLTLLGAGAAAGLLIRRREPGQSWLAMIVRCLLTGVATGVMIAAAAAAAGGSLGAHRLSAVGASPWRVGLAVAGEIGALALVAALADRLVTAWRRDRSDRRDPGEVVDAVATSSPTAPTTGLTTTGLTTTGLTTTDLTTTDLTTTDLTTTDLTTVSLPKPAASDDETDRAAC